MKDVIIVGLGEFGKNTINYFLKIDEERKRIFSTESENKIKIWPIAFTNNEHFNFTQVSKAITELVDSSESKKGRNPFSYIFIGDLYENITSDYALDYAMIPLIFHKDNILMTDNNNIGFFSYSDRLENQEKSPPEKMISILNFFKRFEKVDIDNSYFPPYKNISGKQIGKIVCDKGPLSRNYIIVTPGGKKSDYNMTSQIFAERIFYELYNLMDKYENSENNNISNNTVKGKCFSSFTMVQISRLKEQLLYYLTYCLEDLVTKVILQDIKEISNIDYIENKFLYYLDLIEKKEINSCKRNDSGYKINFPIERAVSIFEKKYLNFYFNHFKHIYVSLEYKDKNNYVEDEQNFFNDTIEELNEKYIDFVKEEMTNMNQIFENEYINLFKNTKLYKSLDGNICAYIRFISDLKNIFESWTEDLQNQVENTKKTNIDDAFYKCKEKINEYQKSFIYNLPFFRPIRKILIINTFINLKYNISNYFKDELKRNLALAFLKYFKDDSSISVNPIKNCNILLNDLYKMREKIQTKREDFISKKEFIENIPQNYYIISQYEQNDSENYSILLKKTYEQNIGPLINDFQISEIAKDFFYSWASNSNNIQDILKNPKGFINHMDKYFSEKSKTLFNTIQVDINEFEKYASNTKDKLLERTKNLSRHSFNTKDSNSFNEILLIPTMETEDKIDECLKSLPPETIRINVDKDFTMGALVYFKDYLFMEYKDLNQYQNLFKQYENEKNNTLQYVDPGIHSDKDEPFLFLTNNSNDENLEKLSIDNLNTKILTSVNDNELDLFDLNSKIILINFFKEKIDKLSNENINAIAKSTNYIDLLNEMSVEQLYDYCKIIEMNYIYPDKNMQIQNIIKYLNKKQSRK